MTISRASLKQFRSGKPSGPFGARAESTMDDNGVCRKLSHRIPIREVVSGEVYAHQSGTDSAVTRVAVNAIRNSGLTLKESDDGTNGIIVLFCGLTSRAWPPSHFADVRLTLLPDCHRTGRPLPGAFSSAPFAGEPIGPIALLFAAFEFANRQFIRNLFYDLTFQEVRQTMKRMPSVKMMSGRY